jgi:hypothetical protein
MPKEGSRAEINTFIQGLITEASPLNFPPNASKNEENFELFRDGTRKRRLGLDVEKDPVYLPTGLSGAEELKTKGRAVFKWEAVSGDPNRELLVIQFNGVLYFYDLKSDESMGNSFKGSWGGFGPLVNATCNFASLEGNLVITFGAMYIGILQYQISTNTFSQRITPLLVRDFWGVEVKTFGPAFTKYETDPHYRGQIAGEQLYNLRNQGWAKPKIFYDGLNDPLKSYYSFYGKYPSNSEIVWTAMQFTPVPADQVPYERIYVELYQQYLDASAFAPKGFFIIDALNRGPSRREEMAKNDENSLPVINLKFTDPIDALRDDSTYGGVSLVAEFAGRAFYAGFGGEVGAGDSHSPNMSNYILFSRLVRNVNDINKCYQEGDPTSREGADIVDSDGGFLRISGAQKIIGLENMGSNLVVFADNGVWAVTGGSDFGFTATNYKVIKISSYGAVSPRSIVNYGGVMMYWGEDAIYRVDADKFAVLKVESMTQVTIQKYYDEIPIESKEFAEGVYDEDNKRVVWLYKEGDSFTPQSTTKELIFDTTINCFYVKRIYNTDKAEAILPFYRENEIYYLTITNPNYTEHPGALTFSTYNNLKFLDWEKIDGKGVDAKAFLLTGSQIAADSAVVKQIPYLVMHFRKTEFETDSKGVPKNQSGCMFRTQWDWATGEQSNKFSALTQGYKYRRMYQAGLPDTKYDNGFETVTSKNKIRGRGRSFALYLETEPLKDCNILGWNLTINGNALA